MDVNGFPVMAANLDLRSRDVRALTWKSEMAIEIMWTEIRDDNQSLKSIHIHSHQAPQNTTKMKMLHDYKRVVYVA